jgi:hypothetical protein
MRPVKIELQKKQRRGSTGWTVLEECNIPAVCSRKEYAGIRLALTQRAANVYGPTRILETYDTGEVTTIWVDREGWKPTEWQGDDV